MRILRVSAKSWRGDALSLAYLEDAVHDDFVKEGAPKEARSDFELLMLAARESVKVRVAQLAALAMDCIDRKRRCEAERRDSIGEHRQWNDDGDVGSVSSARGPGGGRDIGTAPLGK